MSKKYVNDLTWLKQMGLDMIQCDKLWVDISRYKEIWVNIKELSKAMKIIQNNKQYKMNKYELCE